MKNFVIALIISTLIGCGSESKTHNNKKLISIKSNDVTVIAGSPPRKIELKLEYDDGTHSDATSGINYYILNNDRLDSIAVVNGAIKGKVPNTEATLIISKEGVSKEIKILVKPPFTCPDNNFNCLPVLESIDMEGRYFSSTPNKDYYINNAKNEPSRILKESGFNPKGFEGVLLSWDEANSWCEELNKMKYYSRNNWKIPNKNELLSIHTDVDIINKDDFFWPVGSDFWVSSESENRYLRVDLYDRIPKGASSVDDLYVSCISNP